MSIWSFLFGGNTKDFLEPTNVSINPATGLPMIDNSSIDLGGNTYGTSNDWSSGSPGCSSDDWGSSSSFGAFNND
jgi:hypothetical protein